MTKGTKIRIAMADDHRVLRAGLKEVLSKTGRIEVLFDTDDGQELLDCMRAADRLPEVVILDVFMPGMGGVKTAGILKKEFPKCKVIALSMMDDDLDILRMVRNGAIGYILKGDEPSLLIEAIEEAHEFGVTRSSVMSRALIKSMNDRPAIEPLNERQLEFCLLAMSDRTYIEIAKEMNVSPRTIDGYRDELFERFSVRTRVGLVLYCIRHNIVSITDKPLG